ncbi:hypothetical protein DRO61_09830 [Candidatus Bathyarchaeota archaeon]|nr:MAG: hypothetical protein DRO61_09830 [Candidatus Bathyarchaeota archaeon]
MIVESIKTRRMARAANELTSEKKSPQRACTGFGLPLKDDLGKGFEEDILRWLRDRTNANNL